MLLARVKSHLFNVLIVTISISFVIFISTYVNEQNSLHKSEKEYFVSVCCTNNLTSIMLYFRAPEIYISSFIPCNFVLS